MRVLPMGPSAVLVEDVGTDPAAWSLGLRALGLPGVVDVVPAAGTVLVRCESEDALEVARAALGTVRAVAAGDAHLGDVEIPVTYDGEDLAAVAIAIGTSVDHVVELHSSAHYAVAFCGFAPGFAYLAGLAPELRLPRHPTPRTSVPAGAVAIASEYSAVYPRSSPGGWHLLGTTTVALFDPERDPPALLVPGTRVRFVAS